MKDRFKTIKKQVTDVLFKDRNSKFFGFAYPIHSEEDVKRHLNELKKTHYSARHWCYAFQLGNEISGIYYRYNDDGEPSNSAGAPIYGQLQSFELTDILVVVVRYFGGTKLGVSGLINAYKTTAEMALKQADIIEKTVSQYFAINYPYSLTNEVMKIVANDDIEIISQKFETACEMVIGIRYSQVEKIYSDISKIYGLTIKSLEKD